MFSLEVVVTFLSSCLSVFLKAGILVLPVGLLGEKRNSDTLVVEVVEGGVSDLVVGSDFITNMHCDPELGEEDGLGAGDVRPLSARNCLIVVVSIFNTLAFSLNMTRVFLSSYRKSQCRGDSSSCRAKIGKDFREDFLS